MIYLHGETQTLHLRQSGSELKEESQLAKRDWTVGETDGTALVRGIHDDQVTQPQAQLIHVNHRKVTLFILSSNVHINYHSSIILINT